MSNTHESSQVNNNNKSEFPVKGVTYEKFQDFVKSHKGIEALWKNVEKNENNAKFKLFEAENEIIKIVDELTQALDDYKQTTNYKEPSQDAVKKHKSIYNAMVTQVYVGNEKEGQNFIKKFPNWVFNVRSIISNSNHFKRISNCTVYQNTRDQVSRNKDDFIDISTKDLNIKFADRKNGTGKFMKSLQKFGKFFIGKASKTGVEKKVQAFFKRVNAPWRMWWEVVCEKNQALSRENAKDSLAKALGEKSRAKLMKLFNQPFSNAASLKLAINKNNGTFSGDSNNTQRDQMLNVFCNLDKELGNQAREVFGLKPVEEKSFIQKVKNMFKKSKPELKRTKSMGDLKHNLNLDNFKLSRSGTNPNLETIDRKLKSDKTASQTSGNNLTFDPQKVKAINDILNNAGIPENDKIDNLKNNEKVNNVLTTIKEKIGGSYIIKNGRPAFLIAIANHLGLKEFDLSNIQEICKSKVKEIPEKYRNDAVYTVQRVRNLIRHGYNWGAFKSGKNDDLPLELK